MISCQIRVDVDTGNEEPVRRILKNFSMVRNSRRTAPGVVLVDVDPMAPDAATLARSVFRTIGFVKRCEIVGT